jgi:hypothetical protein
MSRKPAAAAVWGVLWCGVVWCGFVVEVGTSRPVESFVRSVVRTSNPNQKGRKEFCTNARPS